MTIMRQDVLRCCSLALFLLLLGVGPATAQKADAPDDGLIEDRVNRELVADKTLGKQRFEVNVKDGVVTVTGFVSTEKLQKRVEKVAKKAKGVREVVNKVEIRKY